MGLLQQTQQQYYDVKKSFTGDGTPPPVDLAADGVAVDHETGQEIEP